MAISYNTSIVRSGLVLHVDAANRKSYPGSGTAWTDLSGNNNNSINYNSSSYNSSGYFTFDGTNQYFEGGSINFSTTAITFASWFRQLSNPSNFTQIIGSATASGAIYIAPSSSNVFGQLSFVTNGNKGTGNTTIPLNVWKHITVTWETGSTIKLYIDGTFSRQSAAFTDTINIVSHRIASYAAGGYLNCDVSNASIYNRALTAAEISQNFEALRGRYGI